MEAALTKSDGDQLCIDKHPRATQHKFEDDMEFSVVYNMLESMFLPRGRLKYLIHL